MVYNKAYSDWPIAVEIKEEDANLMTTAVNACFQVNPSNPQAVAEAVPEMVKVLRTALRDVELGTESVLLIKDILQKAGVK